MIPTMSTLQSWALMILIAILVIALVYLIKGLNESGDKHAQAAEDVLPPRLATVTELRPSKPVRHLALVPDLAPRASLDVYDWEKQGL
jgi:hypothetical protein